MSQPGSRGVFLCWWVAIGFLACGQAPPVPAANPNPVLTPASPAFPAVVDAGPPEGPGAAQSSRGDSGALDSGVIQDGAPSEVAQVATECPSGMILIDTSYCPRIERRCVDEEYSPQNHITICHKYATTQRCLVEEQRRRFCVDEYEYPNQKGAHPPWMVSWYDAQASCQALGKRLCFESEWVTACEGPAKTPFPYGYSRDSSKCNIDNTWIKPNLAEMYGSDKAAQQRELSRLDQSVRSGDLPECVSGYGVHDLTGNFDEWVTADHPYDDKSDWAALKGGAWGHVRNACRPTTTSHPPDFTYYFIGFRCCKDAPGGEAFTPKGNAHVPPVEAGDRAPSPSPTDPPGPSRTKVAREYWPRPGSSKPAAPKTP